MSESVGKSQVMCVDCLLPVERSVLCNSLRSLLAVHKHRRSDCGCAEEERMAHKGRTEDHLQLQSVSRSSHLNNSSCNMKDTIALLIAYVHIPCIKIYIPVLYI